MPKLKKYTLDMMNSDMRNIILTNYKEINGCWEWQGRLLPLGYGAISGNKQTNLVVHRLSWMLHNNQDWPDDLETRHMCHNRKCINPDHLVPGTKEENGIDRRIRNGNFTIKVPKAPRIKKPPRQFKYRLGPNSAGKYDYITPNGRFSKLVQAAKSHGISGPAMALRIKTHPEIYKKIKR